MPKKLGKKERTKQHIMSIAIQLFNNKGIESTTMEDIFQQAQVAKGTLYNHFSSKNEIIDAYVSFIFKENETIRLEKLIEIQTTKERILYIFSDLIDRVRNNQELFEAYSIYRMKEMVAFTEDKKTGLAKLSQFIIEDGQKKGEIRKDVEMSFLIDFFEFIFIEIIKQLKLNSEKPQDKTIKDFVDVFINGIKNN